MFPAFRMPIAFAIACSLYFTSPLIAQDSKIEFDVPAMIGVREILPSTTMATKTIEVQLPISTVIEPGHRDDVDEFRFDVSWNRSVYPLFDYGPRTQTVSDIEGLLNVEKSESRNSGFNAALTSRALELTNAKISSDNGSSSSKRESYLEVPQHDVLIASGTIDRGTGAFFRFHRSRTETLEGGRELVLAYRVPSTWKNGILKVECRASGKRRVAGLWNEPFEFGRSFVIPLYVDGDLPSQQLAIDFARAEQELRKSWIKVEQKFEKMKKRNPFATLVTGSLAPPSELPHLLIQSGEDKYLSQFDGYLTKEVAVAAGKFVQARKSLSRNGAN